MPLSEEQGSNNRQRWARVRPERARDMHGFQPGTWYPVLEEQLSESLGGRLPGYMWIEAHGGPQQVLKRQFEVREEPPLDGDEEWSTRLGG
jgi:hypothetical protein